MPLPTIHLNEVPEDGLTVEATLDAAWLRSALVETGYEPASDPAGRATLRLDKHGRDVLLSGTVDAKLTSACVRCLTGVPLDVHAEFTLNLEPATTRPHPGRKEEVELTADELDVDVYENDRIDLGHWVREQILLEAPAYPTCPERCAEPIEVPQPNPIERDAIDPRLAPLKKLTNKE
jgi:uncharacterized metal-binding protein YceD (DUF177 family)